MASIIDELVLKLGIDPSGLDDGERKLTESLRRMESQASRAASSIGESSKRNIRDYLSGFETQFNAINRNLSRLGEQGHKSGASIAEGAKNASYGISELTFAALSAYGALKAVQGIVGTVQAQVSQTSNLFRTAGMLNPPTGTSTADFARRLFSFSHAAHTTTGVDPAAALATIEQLQVGRQMVRAGLPLPDNLAALSRFFNVDFNAPLEDIIRSLETQAQNDPDALAKLQQAGFGPIAQYLKRGPGANARSEALETPYAPTNQAFDSAQKLTEQTGLLGDSFDRLWRSMIVTNPAVEKFIEILKTIIDFLGDPNSFINRPIDHLLGDQRDWDKTRDYEAWRRTFPLGQSPTTQQWKNWSDDWDKSHPGGTSMNAPGPGTAAMAARLGGLQPDDIALMQRESHGNPNIGWGQTDLTGVPLDSTGFPMWPGKMGPAGNSTAAGLWQITGSNWHRIAPILGIHDFSPESQLRVRRFMQDAARRAGHDPNIDWGGTPLGTVSTSYHGFYTSPQGTITHTELSDYYNTHGHHFINDPQTVGAIRPPGLRADEIAAIQTGHAGYAPVRNVRSNVSTGDIHIHGHGEAAGRAAADALHSQIRVNLSNTGVSGP